jgi:lactaldehyde reductase
VENYPAAYRSVPAALDREVQMVNRFVLNTISYHGSSAIKEIPGEIQHHGYTKEFVCSDLDLVKLGITDKVTNLLDEAKIPWSLYSETKPNSTIHNVQDGVVTFKKFGADMIVAIGGSVRAADVIAENSEFFDVVSLEGIAPTKKHATFALAAPITAGTEAEVTINYVIADPKEARKFVCVDTNDIPEITVVDPGMMALVLAGLTAATGMDTPTHAIEGYTTTAALELSDMFRYKATETISHNLRDAYAEAKRGKPA